MTRRATLVGAKRYAAAGGGYRRDAEVRKQGELRNAPSEQGDCVFEGQARQILVRHNPKVVGSSPASATTKGAGQVLLLFV